MMKAPEIIDNVHIKKLSQLISPGVLHSEIQLDESTIDLISATRKEAAKIIQGDDNRQMVIVGPCSIHDPKAALEYAKKLRPLIDKYRDGLCIIMRVYFEKPRTTIGWKGLINDPDMNGNFQINNGLRIARQLLHDINALGVPTGTEFLDTTIPQYISDLISWAAIGARTTESQIHRELSSGLSMPIGFKNGTTGSIQIAIDAIQAASHPHHFLGVTKEGSAAIVSTTGNPDCHVILRGASSGPNYDPESVNKTASRLEQTGLSPRVMIDCSHGNSSKDHKKQSIVLKSVCKQLENGSQHILGVMIESNLIEGNQPMKDLNQLTYGQSVTDACIGWDETEQLLDNLYQAVKRSESS